MASRDAATAEAVQQGVTGKLLLAQEYSTFEEYFIYHEQCDYPEGPFIYQMYGTFVKEFRSLNEGIEMVAFGWGGYPVW